MFFSSSFLGYVNEKVASYCSLLKQCSSIQQSARNPKLFWVSAAAPLVSVILSTVIVYLIKNETHVIPTVSKSYMHRLYFHPLFSFRRDHDNEDT